MLLVEIIGINAIRLSSSPNQAVNQELDEMAIKVPRIRHIKNIVFVGFGLAI